MQARLKNGRLASEFEGGAPIGASSPALEKALSAVYLIALVGVGVSILWLLVEAVVSVSRKPCWETQVFRSLTLVPTEERRKEQLPFVGVNRRTEPAAPAVAGDRKAA